MKPPKQITVGPVRYRVLFCEFEIARAERGDADRLYAHHDPRKQQITVDPDQGPDQLADSLLHEVLHACVAVTGLDETLGDREESVVRSLSTCLLQVLRENPRLVGWICDPG